MRPIGIAIIYPLAVCSLFMGVVVVVVVLVVAVTTVSASVTDPVTIDGPSTGLLACAFRYDIRLMPRSESSSNHHSQYIINEILFKLLLLLN